MSAAGKFNYDNADGRFEYLDGLRVVWRSDASPAFLLPDSYGLEWDDNLAYPDFVKGNGMFYGSTGSGGTQSTWALVFPVIRPGDWGPDQSGTYLLPRILLGTVPAACNYLDVTLNFTQTHAPWPAFYVLCTEYQKEGEDICLDGGCALLEGAEFFRRIVKVVLAATDNGDADVNGIGATRNVYLERYQSVPQQASFVSNIGMSMKSGVQSFDGSATNNWANLWTHDGNPAGWLGYIIDSIGTGGDLHKMRGGSNAPPTTDNSDYSAVWAATITVRPGFVHT